MKGITYQPVVGDPDWLQELGKLTGGKPINYQGVAAISYGHHMIGGEYRLLVIRIEGRRKQLDAQVAQYEREAQAEAERKAWRPEGYEIVRAAHRAYGEAYHALHEGITDGTGREMAREIAARKRLDEARHNNPAAALWLDAEMQRDGGHWSDPVGARAAARKALDLMRDGASMDEARTALAERKDVGPWR